MYEVSRSLSFLRHEEPPNEIIEKFIDFVMDQKQHVHGKIICHLLRLCKKSDYDNLSKGKHEVPFPLFLHGSSL